MGEIPSGPLFSVKLWFAVALLTSVGISVGQVTSAPPPVSPPQKISAPVSAPERKTLSREVPAQTEGRYPDGPWRIRGRDFRITSNPI